MIDPRNTSLLTGGIVADPEVVNGNIAKFRMAVDYAGSEKGSGNNTGYFDVIYYLNNDDSQRNAKFVRDQIESGKLKKGSQISLVARLVQERWTTDEKKNARVVLVAEALTYASSGGSQNTKASEGPAQAELPTEF